MTEKAENKGGLIDNISRYRGQIMGFAAVWIIFFHMRNEVVTFQNVPVLRDIDVFFANIGFNGVDMFLFISGWGMYHAMKSHKLLVFYKRRFRRLVLPFLVACLANAVYYKWNLLRLSTAATGWTFFTENIYEPRWFILAIALYYLYFPVYYEFFERMKNKFLYIALTVSLWALITAILPYMFERTDIYRAIGRIPVFMIGVLFGWITYYKKEFKLPLAWFVIIASLCLGFQAEFYVAFRKVVLLNEAISICLPGVLIGIPLCFVLGWVFKVIDRVSLIQKAYGFVGMISLEFYAVQETIIVVLKDKIYSVGVEFDNHLFVLIVFILSLGLGYVLYLVNTMISKLLDREPIFTKAEGK